MRRTKSSTDRPYAVAIDQHESPGFAFMYRPQSVGAPGCIGLGGAGAARTVMAGLTAKTSRASRKLDRVFAAMLFGGLTISPAVVDWLEMMDDWLDELLVEVGMFGA